MGDGSISYGNSKNPSIQCSCINKKYLNYLDNFFGLLSTEPFKSRTAEELAESNRKSGFDPSANAKTYSDQYYWKTVSHPELKKFSNWYDSGEKVWPEDMVLTPTILKHWYCGDGHYNNYNNGRIEISMDNEYKNNKKVLSYFDNININLTESRFNKYKRKDGRQCCTLQFRESQSEILWECMGDPIPGFEHKWPERFK